MCYFSGWALYRPKPWDTKITDLDPKLCTHVIYSFAGLDENTLTIKALDEEMDIEKGNDRIGSITADFPIEH